MSNLKYYTRFPHVNKRLFLNSTDVEEQTDARCPDSLIIHPRNKNKK